MKVSGQTEQGSPLLSTERRESSLVCQLGQFWQPPVAKPCTWLCRAVVLGGPLGLPSVQVVTSVGFIQVLRKLLA